LVKQSSMLSLQTILDMASKPEGASCLSTTTYHVLHCSLTIPLHPAQHFHPDTTPQAQQLSSSSPLSALVLHLDSPLPPSIPLSVSPACAQSVTAYMHNTHTRTHTSTSPPSAPPFNLRLAPPLSRVVATAVKFDVHVASAGATSGALGAGRWFARRGLCHGTRGRLRRS
jgi:hypothetical protein